MAERDTKTILAMKLKELRKRAGLTVYEVGNAVGKSGKTVSSWEQGHGQPDADVFMKLYFLYRVTSMSEFFGILDKDMPVNEVELLEQFRKLNDEGQRLALAAIKSFARSGDYLRK